MALIAEPIDSAPSLQLGESPRWDPRQQRLACVDISGQRVIFWREGHTEQVAAPGRVGMIAPCATGGWLVAVGGGVRLLDDNGAWGPELVRVAPTGLRLNDGRCDAAGRLWVGTYGDVWVPGASAFYRVESGGHVTTVFEDITCSNGVGWSPDARTLYYIDSGAWRVDRCTFDLERGTVGERCPAVTFPQSDGVPDGMAVDVEGMLWVAIMSSYADDGCVLRCDPATGRILDRVTVPGAGAVTACAFGGPDLRDLYITTSHELESLHRAEKPAHAGKLFRVRAPVSGLSEHGWRGDDLRAM